MLSCVLVYRVKPDGTVYVSSPFPPVYYIDGYDWKENKSNPTIVER